MTIKQFFTNPITITVGLILTAGVLAIIGYNYWGWFGGKTKQPLGAIVPPYPNNPKEGDKFTYKGIEYTYSCIQPACLLPPCPPICDWKITSNWIPTNRQSNQQNSVNETSGRNSNTAKKKCWEQAWTDSSGRKFQFEIWAVDCNSTPVSDAKNLLISGLNGGKLGTELNSSQSLKMPLNDLVNNLIYELTGYYSKGVLQFKIAGNGVYGTGTTFTPPPPTQWNIYITTQDASKHTAILRGVQPVPTQFKIGQKINVVLHNPWNPEPNRSYQATILGFTGNPMEIVTDIPYVPLTNVPPNTISTMGSGNIIL